MSTTNPATLSATLKGLANMFGDGPVQISDGHSRRLAAALRGATEAARCLEAGQPLPPGLLDDAEQVRATTHHRHR